MPGNFLRLTVEDDVQPRRADHAEVLERPVALPPRDEVAGADHVARPVAADVVLPDRDDALGVAIGQRLEHHAADDAEDGGGGANPERQRQHRRNGEAWRAEERADGEAKVLEEIALHMSLR